MFTLDYDFAWDCPLTNFAELLEPFLKQGASITKIIQHGPGGGNPQVYISFPTKELQHAFNRAYDPTDESNYRDL